VLDLKVEVFVDFQDVLLMFLAHIQVSAQLVVDIGNFIVFGENEVDF
jgi:hypothetical protein